MRTSAEGIKLIQFFEGCYLEAYLCPARVWTIGYGHTKGVKEGDVIDQEAAEALFIEDIEEFEMYVTKLVEVPLEQNHFDALVSWTFNLGPTNLRSSTLLKKLNDGLYGEVPEQLKRWVFSGGVKLRGLERRRLAEAALWRGEDWRLVAGDAVFV